jgi:GNAT superfamily N-acetyltransferase
MDIREWDPANLGDLAHIYNAQIAATVPHCYPVTPEEMGTALDQKTGEDFSSSLGAERVLVGLARGRVRGFAHVTVGEIVHQGNRQRGGFIHLLTYEAGHRALGQALYEACEGHCRDAGARTIWAFDGYAYRFFHLGFPLVSDKMGHVYGLFGMNGLQLPHTGELFMEALDYSIVPPVAPRSDAKVRVDVQAGQGDLPNLTIRAFRGGTEIGSCVAFSCGDYCRASQAQDRVFVDGLGVIEAEQGRGWGRTLLMRTLQEARQLGYRHAVISTDKRNYRAQLFYTNYGFRVTDTVCGFVGALE